MFRYVLGFIIINIILTSLNKNKRILVNIFPGAKSHNFVMKDLFEFTLSQKDNYEYHILIHNADVNLWNEPFKIFSYGDLNLYEEVFKSAVEQFSEDPVFGYFKFNQAMIHIYEQFFKYNMFEELKKYNYDMIITDIPNFISVFLKRELKIKNSMFLSPPCLPNLFYEDFEINSSYLPAIGTAYGDVMTFKERFFNSIYVIGSKITFRLFMGQQVDVFKKYGYEMDIQLFKHDSLILVQSPPGIAFNFSKPPNFIQLNAITPRKANPLKNKELDIFMNAYIKNIYISQGTLVNVINIKSLIDLFNILPDYGFILNLKIKNKDISFPKNVFVLSWVAQNDLLGDKRLNAFITHCGINSVMESLYHEKPVIGLGLAMDQLNTAGLINDRKIGKVILNRDEVTSQNLKNLLVEILKEDNPFTNNLKKYSNILKHNQNAREVFNYWIEYGFELGYEHLIVKAYSNLNYLELNNYDIVLTWMLIFFLMIFISKKILVAIFCSCKVKKKYKID